MFAHVGERLAEQAPQPKLLRADGVSQRAPRHETRSCGRLAVAGRGQQRASHAGKSKEDPSSGFHDFARSLGIPEAAPDTHAQRSAEHAPGPSAPGTRVPMSLSWSAGRPEPAWEWMPVPSTSVPGPEGSKAGEQARAPGEQLPSKPRAAGSEGTPVAKNEEVSHCQSPEARGSSWGLRKGGRRASPTGPGPALLRTHGPCHTVWPAPGT